ncbi:Gfo/Idh/MocA family protein [Chryseolinea lacunae]|uniref:Gfo/Idh/MocA family oxidoreductase n=1 Tax=Chryseolinea lacunae TaxID=2801331 RepID=A0ABS1KWW7_9BACT|nr:Gfo/Idh/MocA family oxidoreductase [Chryseolinea lacunae]MBL0743712.1 Gfo/Idh/MocA family oxidoreductase [Chryseolinea lacunae]
MTRTYKWGILGPGKIAHRFADAVRNVPGSSIYAVASRDQLRAEEFAAKYSARVVYESYRSLVEDPAVDIVYIATPHSFHEAQTLLCLEHKKPVLCEKPMTVNYASALKMVQAARANNTFLMEAMWTRFMPATLKVLELVQAGAIGDVKCVRGDFGDQFAFDPTSRVYDLKLGAGSVLDIGIYPLFLILLLLGKPDQITSVGHLAETGADDLASALLYYNSGKIGSMLSSNIVHTPIAAEVIGTEGTLSLHPFWYETKTISLHKFNEPPVQIDVGYSGNGFEFQIQEVLACLDRGAKESTLMPLDFTLLLSQTMDEICRQVGVAYTPQPPNWC